MRERPAPPCGVTCDADRPETIGASVLRIIPPELHSDEPIILAEIRSGQSPVWNFHHPVIATTERPRAMCVPGAVVLRETAAARRTTGVS